MFVALIMTACGSSHGGGCDAYGSIDKVESADIAAK
jgi:hypothetical protein